MLLQAKFISTQAVPSYSSLPPRPPWHYDRDVPRNDAAEVVLLSLLLVVSVRYSDPSPSSFLFSVHSTSPRLPLKLAFFYSLSIWLSLRVIVSKRVLLVLSISRFFFPLLFLFCPYFIFDNDVLYDRPFVMTCQLGRCDSLVRRRMK